MKWHKTVQLEKSKVLYTVLKRFSNSLLNKCKNLGLNFKCKSTELAGLIIKDILNMGLHLIKITFMINKLLIEL